MDSNQQYSVRAVERVLNVLEVFKDNSSGFSLTEICLLTGLNKSTAFRLLNMLKERHYLKYNEDNRKYTLGLMALILGNAAFESLDIRKCSKPYLIEASNKTNLISHLGILDETHVIIIEKIWPSEKKNFIKMVSEVGRIVPAHCTGLGKVLLSGKSDEFIRETYTERVFEIYSERTIKNVDMLLDSIRDIREKGYAVNCGEHEPYIQCITYPVYDVKGEIVTAVSLTGLIEKYKHIDQAFIHSILKSATAGISRELGYREQN